MDILSFFEDKIILVIGGTGSIGSEIIAQLSKLNPRIIRILSNSENELWESRLKWQDSQTQFRFLLGDIRDFERIKRASHNVDYIFNAAAIKHVPFSEYNPMEAINVNIHGLENIIEASFENNVNRLIQISTDKAVNPTTVMGATKMLSERLSISRGLARGKYPTIISTVRFGNVLGSRGSIIPLIKTQIKNNGVVSITDLNMKRFFMSVSEAANLVLKSMVLANGGEIFVLKMPVILIKDLIEVIIEDYSPKLGIDPSSIKIKVIGAREGEKLNEELISPIEYPYTRELDDMYIIYPSRYFKYEKHKGKIIKTSKEINIESFNYNTKNINPLSKKEIKELLKKSDLN